LPFPIFAAFYSHLYICFVVPLFDFGFGTALIFAVLKRDCVGLAVRDLGIVPPAVSDILLGRKDVNSKRSQLD
jgi:hypothetical protein